MEGRTWKSLKKGQSIREGTTVSTGARSNIVLKIDDHQLTLKSFTTIKIFKNRLDKNSSENNIALKHGSVNAKVNRIGRLKTNFNIATPVATSSVRGTEQKTRFGIASGMRLRTPFGSVNVHNKSGVSKTVKGRSFFSQGGDSPRPDGLNDDTKKDALISSVTGGLTGDELAGLETFGDQLTGNIEDPFGLLVPQGGVAQVKVDLIWP